MIPATASATPASVRLLGLRRVVAHTQPTTRIGRGVLQQQRDADRQVRDRVVVEELGAGDRDQPRTATTVLAWRSASPTHPGRTTVANTAITRAPPASRAMTAAVGLQPASISALANGPDDPNANAEPTAKHQTEPEVLDSGRVRSRSWGAPPAM